jgi:hypothetical protein
MDDWWSVRDTYALSMWVWFLFLLWGSAKIISWTVFAKKRKQQFYTAQSKKKRAPIMRAFFGEPARRASADQRDWEKVDDTRTIPD